MASVQFSTLLTIIILIFYIEPNLPRGLIAVPWRWPVVSVILIFYAAVSASDNPLQVHGIFHHA